MVRRRAFGCTVSGGPRDHGFIQRAGDDIPSFGRKAEPRVLPPPRSEEPRERDTIAHSESDPVIESGEEPRESVRARNGRKAYPDTRPGEGIEETAEGFPGDFRMERGEVQVA